MLPLAWCSFFLLAYVGVRSEDDFNCSFAAGSETEQTGRATCGDSEGREYVSNANPLLVEGVKCIEYWGRTNPAAVPRAFGGPTA